MTVSADLRRPTPAPRKRHPIRLAVAVAATAGARRRHLWRRRLVGVGHHRSPHPDSAATTTGRLSVDTLRAGVEADVKELNNPVAVVLVSSSEGQCRCGAR